MHFITKRAPKRLAPTAPTAPTAPKNSYAIHSEPVKLVMTRFGKMGGCYYNLCGSFVLKQGEKLSGIEINGSALMSGHI